MAYPHTRKVASTLARFQRTGDSVDLLAFRVALAEFERRYLVQVWVAALLGVSLALGGGAVVTALV